MGDTKQQLWGDQKFFFPVLKLMNQVFPTLPTADKIAVLALGKVMPVVHSDVIKVVETNGEIFPRTEK